MHFLLKVSTRLAMVGRLRLSPVLYLNVGTHVAVLLELYQLVVGEVVYVDLVLEQALVRPLACARVSHFYFTACRGRFG